MWSVVCSEDTKSPAMVSFNVDPQWCGLLFSIYCRHEKASLTGGFPSPDALATCAFQGPQLDADWLALAGSLGFELCRLSDTWALVFESVKATSVILLLGVSGMVCYKLYHYYWPRPRTPPRDSNENDDTDGAPPRGRRRIATTLRAGLQAGLRASEQLLEAGDEPDYGTVHTRYFGPSATSYDDDSADQADQSASTSASEDSGEEEEGDISEDIDRCIENSRFHRPCHYRQSKSFTMRNANRSSAHSLMLAHSRSRSASCERPGWLLHTINRDLTPKKGSSLPCTPGRRIRAVSNQRKTLSRCLFPEGQASSRVSPEGEESTVPVACAITLPHLDTAVAVVPDPSKCTVQKDTSLDSLGFSETSGCPIGFSETSGCPFQRDGSFDSTCSDLSLDFPPPDSIESTTMACMEQLQKAIQQVKDHCTSIDEDFETIKSNRNLPGMTDLIKASDAHAINADDTDGKEETARKCFAGLYSLTTIKNSISSELSSESALLSCKQNSLVDSAESLEWDSPKVVSPLKIHQNINNLKEQKESDKSPQSASCSGDKSRSDTTLALSEDDLMANLEWDNEGLTQYPDVSGDSLSYTEPNLIAAVETIEMDLETELATPCNRSDATEKSCESLYTSSRSCTASPITERHVSVGSQSTVSQDVNIATVVEEPETAAAAGLAQSASEESGYMDWDNCVENQKISRKNIHSFGSWTDISTDVSSSDQTSPDSEVATPANSESATGGSVVCNVGTRCTLLQYASEEWHGQTMRANTILKGYADIPSQLGVENIRVIRGDNYCAIRATLFQALVQGLHILSGQATFNRISQAIDNGCSWLQDWQFAGRLPYSGNNVLHGMHVCLESLDSMASLIRGLNDDREDALAHILNSDILLDLHLMEAVKLHMLVSAMQLYDAICAGIQEVPLFAVLIFARDSSETPRDLMNNHLQAVGNTAGLEQVEMFLLGYSLGVKIKVVRPSAYGTPDFICEFPDITGDMWPHINIIADDDRHYNILV